MKYKYLFEYCISQHGSLKFIISDSECNPENIKGQSFEITLRKNKNKPVINSNGICWSINKIDNEYSEQGVLFATLDEKQECWLKPGIYYLTLNRKLETVMEPLINGIIKVTL